MRLKKLNKKERSAETLIKRVFLLGLECVFEGEKVECERQREGGSGWELKM